MSRFMLEDEKKVQSIGSAYSLPIKHNIEPLLVQILPYKYNQFILTSQSQSLT